MTEQDKQEFGAIMAGLAENFGVQVSSAGLKLRFAALEKFHIEQVRSAAMSILGTRKFTSMPTIADFLEHLSGGSAEDRGQVEASKVWQALSEVGSYQDVVFDDPVTQAVIVNGFGGWQRLCSETMVDQQKWFIKEFVQYYGAYSRQGIKHYGALPGRFGEKVFFIGNKDKAEEVLRLADVEPDKRRLVFASLNQNRVKVDNKLVGKTNGLPGRIDKLLPAYTDVAVDK